MPAILLFVQDPAQPRARIIYAEDEFNAPVGAVFAAFETQLAAQAATTLAREVDALLTVQFPMPPELSDLGAQPTVLTLTFEGKGGATKLTLTHAGFGRGETWDRALGYFTQGWPAVLAQMKDGIVDASHDASLAA